MMEKKEKNSQKQIFTIREDWKVKSLSFANDIKNVTLHSMHTQQSK